LHPNNSTETVGSNYHILYKATDSLILKYNKQGNI